MPFASFFVMTRIAIPVFNNQVSTVLDYSSRFVLVVLDGEQVQGRLEMALSPESPEMFLWALAGFRTDILICGAVSSSLRESLARRGIEVISCARGPVDQVIRAYMQGKLAAKRFRLPGSSAPSAPSQGQRSSRKQKRTQSLYSETFKEAGQ